MLLLLLKKLPNDLKTIQPFKLQLPNLTENYPVKKIMYLLKTITLFGISHGMLQEKK
jgi:hypothetical protein